MPIALRGPGVLCMLCPGVLKVPTGTPAKGEGGRAKGGIAFREWPVLRAGRPELELSGSHSAPSASRSAPSTECFEVGAGKRMDEGGDLPEAWAWVRGDTLRVRGNLGSRSM